MGRALICDTAEEFRYCIPHLSDALQSGSSDPWICGGRAALQVKCNTDWTCAFAQFGGYWGQTLSTMWNAQCCIHWRLLQLKQLLGAWSGCHRFIPFDFINPNSSSLSSTKKELTDSLHLQIKLTVLGQTAKFVVGDPPLAKFVMLVLFNSYSLSKCWWTKIKVGVQQADELL